MSAIVQQEGDEKFSSPSSPRPETHGYVRFRVGRVEAEVTRQDAARLVDFLLARGTPASVSVALQILEAEEAA